MARHLAEIMRVVEDVNRWSQTCNPAVVVVVGLG